jgi:hypothetical protein
MPVLIECACGQKLSVRDEYLGKRIKCPACGASTLVAGPPGTGSPPPPPYASPPPREREEDEEEERPRRKKRLAKKRRGKVDVDDGGWFGPERRLASGGILVGLLLMVGAGVWFILGLMGDRIFFYPPILFVVGLIAFVKGLMGRD